MPSEFKSARKLPHIPDDITTEEFTLEYDHTIRPARPEGTPWLVVDKTGRKVDLDQIRKRTRALEVGLRNQGIGEDDVVLLFSSNHIDYPICIWAAHRLLATVSPCNPTFTASELGHQLRQTKPALIIAHANVLNTAVEGARAFGLASERVVVLTDDDNADAKYPNHLTVQDLISQGLSVPYSSLTRKLRSGEGRKKIAFLSPSSGTTGLPKILALSHFAIIAGVLMVSAHLQPDEVYTPGSYRPGDVCLGIPPFYHIYGIILILHVPVFLATTVVVVPKFGFKEMLNSIVRHRVSLLTVVPPQIVMLLKDPTVRQFDLSSVRIITCGGAPLSVGLTKQLAQLFPSAQIGQAYGQTEATGGISISSVSTKVGLSCGSLLPGIVARVLKPDGSLATRGEPGELYVKTPAMATGYWGDELATRKTFIDGWIRTGDLVMFDDKEEIVYLDRLKEIIKVNGFQVSPADIEACLLDHPMVADVCVVGIPHETSGERPLAFVVLTPAVAPMSQQINGAEKIKKDLMQHVAANKARYKHLGRVEFIDTIPKNPSGKILRRFLQARVAQLVGSNVKL
ncbi:phenylacetyl-CoA ligase [Mycena maculata]|uniref:Phenylacetyl-CoA ligase n=1 Tax=Mycena maculata TaxID=230809 RepID=A0AAD7NEC3_9AGAR|nr:phenylacetyl-CoA ligase [Mycena maculata]